MFTLQSNRTKNCLVKVSRANVIGSAFYLGFMLCVLAGAPACSQGQPADASTSFPPLTPYQHKDFSFRIPEGWTVKVIQDDERALALNLEENPNDPITSPQMLYLRYPSIGKSITPQLAVKRLLAQLNFENQHVQQEQLKSAHYYALLLTFTYKDVPGKGVFYSYFDDQGALTLIHFNATQDRFDSLGGAALPFVTFEDVNPSQIKLSGEFQTIVEAFPISLEAVFSPTETPSPFPVLGLATELGITAPLHWTVSKNLLTGEINLSENPQDPASPLVVSKTFKLDELLTPSQLTQNFNPITALVQGLATLNIKAVRQYEHVFVDGNNQRVFLAQATRAGVTSKLAALYDVDQQKQTFDLVVFVAPTARYTDLGGAMLIGVTLGAFDPATFAKATFNSLRPNANASDAALLTKILAHNVMKARVQAQRERARERQILALRLAKIQAEANMFTSYSNTINQIHDNVANSVEPVDYYFDYTIDEYVPCSNSGTTFGSC